MRRTSVTILALMLGAIIGYGVVLGGWIAYSTIANPRDFEGAMSMGIAFFYAPVAGLLCAFVAAVLVWRRL